MPTTTLAFASSAIQRTSGRVRTRAFATTQAPYLVEMDDDVVSAPDGWDTVLLEAFRSLPRMGYLAANLADDPYDTAVRYIRYLREERKAYVRVVENGIAVLEGPTGEGAQ